ncbi:MAG: hypothetical protein K0S32_8 [Bacteroidetes bacterium]|jgi:hypothetical protein|nr:hypothetical protein [Bacteroidota bacterium]
MKKQLLLLLSVILLTSICFAQTEVELAGKPSMKFPHFHFVQNFNGDQKVNLAIDGKLYPAIDNITADVYVVADKSASQWALNNTLLDITSGGKQSFTFSNDSIQQNILQLTAANELIAYNGPGIGVGYDVVIDMDNNGILSSADYIDGGDGAGFYVLHDLAQLGSLPVTTIDWTQTTYLTKRIWYPSNIASMDSLPLIVISHGWTHNYAYYDYIGSHLASYGYIVMSHHNDVSNGGPGGTQLASLSLIANINHLLGNQDTLFSGVLNGKIDHHRMGWMGHSTGGETPVRAYTRLHNNEISSAYFAWGDVKYINSICPVAWLSVTEVNPYSINYHQFIGGADTDVSGMPIDNYTQPMTIYERGTGNKHVMYVHGAGHGVFHNDVSAWEWASGPNLVSRAQLHPLVKGYVLAMSELYCKQNNAGKEFFTRSYSEYRPMNTNDSVVISNECRESQLSGKRVIDDFETNTSLNLSSSSAIVTTNLVNSSEILMKDVDGSFTPGNAANGMTRARFTDSPHCLVVEWNSPGYISYTIPDSLKDFSGYEFLSLRACQRTQHPFNVTLDTSINFMVSFTDEAAKSSSVITALYSPVIQTYQREGGWQNEFCTIRIRLKDFLVNGTQLDLSKIELLQFSFGGTGTSTLGALGIDDIELVKKEMSLATTIKEMQITNENKLFIYPNPFSEKVTIQSGFVLKNASCMVYNLYGQSVKQIDNVSGKSFTISRDNLSNGLYFVQLMQDGKVVGMGKVILVDK